MNYLLQDAKILTNATNLTLLFSASRYGWSSDTMYDKVNRYNNTFTLIKSRRQILGGYASSIWEDTSDTNYKDLAVGGPEYLFYFNMDNYTYSATNSTINKLFVK